MRKTLIALAGATALAISSAASAAVTVTSSSGLNNPDPAAAGSVVTNGTTTTINFGANQTSSNFSGMFTFTNTLAGVYNIIVGTSTPGVTFSSASLTSSSGTCSSGCALSPFPDNTNLKLANVLLGSTGSPFTFAIAGTGTGAFTGNVTISAAPEPGTWGMMILGFGAVGMAMRGRRRRTVLAQVA
jgi:hypothetical protein